MKRKYVTKRGFTIDLDEIACYQEENKRSVFTGEGEGNKQVFRMEYDFVIILKSGKEFILESEYYMNDINKIKEIL